MVLGSIHGRFQPFHNGHLQYAIEALHRCDILYVGLTKVLTEMGQGDDVAPHRSRTDSNPFFYRERVSIIRSALVSAGISLDRFGIGPFPIENPERLEEFWSKDDICFTTIVDDWNRRKIELLIENGFSVEALKQGAWSGEKYASGTRIRGLIRSADQDWRKYVPNGAIQEIDRILADRQI